MISASNIPKFVSPFVWEISCANWTVWIGRFIVPLKGSSSLFKESVYVSLSVLKIAYAVVLSW